MNPISRLFVLFSTIAAVFAGPQAHAANGYVGVDLGPSFLNNNIGTQFVYGAEGEWLAMPNFGIGLYLTNESLGGGSGSVPGFGTVSASGNMFTLAAKGTYFLQSDQMGLNFSLLMGLAISSVSASAGGVSGSSSSTNFAIAPDVGYNFPLGNGFSVGPQINYFIVTTSGSTTQAFNLLANASYWF